MVGQRVVVRRLVPGETGPTGGPAMTDLLGICESWSSTTASIRAEDGTLVEIPVVDIVSGKPVPPRPSRFLRLSEDEVARRCSALFRPAEVEHVGDWTFRFTGGANARPNSILPLGDPGLPLDDVLERAHAFYAKHGRAPVAQVIVGSAVQQELESRSWVRLRPAEADSEVLLAGVAQLSRALSGTATEKVRYETEISYDWLVGNTAAQQNYDVVAASLALDEIAFAVIHQDGVQVARARTSIVEDWALFADLTVDPAHRRRGLGLTMMAAMTDWAAERGASVMALQVVGDNRPALQLYDGLGFHRHHAYRYLTPG